MVKNNSTKDLLTRARANKNLVNRMATIDGVVFSNNRGNNLINKLSRVTNKNLVHRSIDGAVYQNCIYSDLY